MNESQKLLADYVKRGSDAAFRELVARYINLVHSTAVRLLNGDAHLAEDITQTVFVNLARKAHTLSPDVMLGGWLHRDTCFVAGTTMRGERRRHFRERQAVAMNIADDHTAANLASVAPILDEAINQLEPDDRTAILLRYFEQLEYRAVGEAIGSNEDAARMRVSRALDKLHALLKHRGVAFSGAALGAALATEAVTAAPFGLAATVAGTALAGATTGGAAATFFKFMTMTKIKIAVASVLAAAALALPLVMQHQSLAGLRAENEALQQQAAQVDTLQAENERLSNLVAQASAAPPATPEEARELARLRNAVVKLRNQTNVMGRELVEMRQHDGAAARPGLGKRSFHNITMTQFAKFIAGVLNAPVADHTGLTGMYDIEMTPPRLGGEDSKLERVTGILRDELGLQLDSFAGPFSAEEKHYVSDGKRGFVYDDNGYLLPDAFYSNGSSQIVSEKVQQPDGSYLNVSSTINASNGGYAITLDRLDAPGLKPATQEQDAASENSSAVLYDAETPGMAPAVAYKLRMIDSAKQQWALEFRKQNTDTPTWNDIMKYLPRGGSGDMDFTKPHNGVYIIGSVGAKPQIRATPAAEAAWSQPEDPVASKRNACINNLRLIDSAKQQWALEFRKQNTDTPTPDDLRPYLGRGEKGELPVCPDGGVYTYGTVGEKPICTSPGHVLP